MRISDWSSDVCSSDLVLLEGNRLYAPGRGHVLRYVIHPLANLVGVKATGHFSVVIAIGGGQLEIARHFHRRLELEAFRFDLACLKIGRASCRERVCQYV